MAYLIVEQRVDRQDRSLQQPCLKIRWHPRFAGKHSFQPETRRFPPDRLAERVALGVRGLDRVRQRDRDWLLYPDGLRRCHCLLAGELWLYQCAHTLGLALTERGPLGLIGTRAELPRAELPLAEPAVRLTVARLTGERDRRDVVTGRRERRGRTVRIPWPCVGR